MGVFLIPALLAAGSWGWVFWRLGVVHARIEELEQ